MTSVLIMAPDVSLKRENSEVSTKADPKQDDLENNNNVSNELTKETKSDEAHNDEHWMPKEETKRLRQEHVGPNVDIFFKADPLKIVRGRGQYLYDEEGNQYLD